MKRYYQSVQVRAPGSSANLGPGFDILGMAISRYVWADDAGLGEQCDADHIANVAFKKAGGHGPIFFRFELEPGRGLGFSAAARAAGALLARLQQGDEVEKARSIAYQIVATLEGHGDNAAPAVFGGMHVVAGEIQHRLEVKPLWRLLFWIPEKENSTEHSRAGLPTEVSRQDAVFNLGRVALLTAALYEGRLDLLATATADRLHQPIRFENNKSSAKAYAVALEAGASAAWLSGSGPTVVAVVGDRESQAVQQAWAGSGKVLELHPDYEGAVVEKASADPADAAT